MNIRTIEIRKNTTEAGRLYIVTVLPADQEDEAYKFGQWLIDQKKDVEPAGLDPEKYGSDQVKLQFTTTKFKNKKRAITAFQSYIEEYEKAKA